MVKNQNGFLYFIVLAVIFVFISVGAVGYLVNRSLHKATKPTTNPKDVSFLGHDILEGSFPQQVTKIVTDEQHNFALSEPLDTYDSELSGGSCSSDYYDKDIVRCANDTAYYYNSNLPAADLVSKIVNQLQAQGWKEVAPIPSRGQYSSEAVKAAFTAGNTDDSIGAIKDVHNVGIEISISIYPKSLKPAPNESRAFLKVRKLYEANQDFHTLCRLAIEVSYLYSISNVETLTIEAQTPLAKGQHHTTKYTFPLERNLGGGNPKTIKEYFGVGWPTL